MAYISRNNILAAYKKLSQMHSDPNAQGATQKISAIRHFLALDNFYKLHNRDCNTRDKDDKEEFANLVGKVCEVCQDLYTTNFYYPLKRHTGDYSVGSNFYSAGQVNASLVNPNEIFDYPKRGGIPLMNVQNGVLERNVSLYHNFSNYITSTDYAVALVIWLIRKISIEQSNGKTLYDNIYLALSKIFTLELLNVLFKDSAAFEQELNKYNLIFNENFYSIQENDIENLFDVSSDEEKYPEFPISYQVIFYGAPGTGKSYSVKRETDAWEKKGRAVRTTFHPDSDYSTFVGAYKPTTESVQRYDIYNKPITRDGEPVMEQIITYEFVAQAFLQAYINAWKNREEPEFLIIEEINRGNCAQIFGDLFQLLDRGDDGYSEYSVRADKDLQKHLAKAFADVVLDDYPKVKSGEVLTLPKNLYIRATMNTSDQSLFPIDSAFKRRWDWKYIPIAKGKDNKGVELNWLIDIDGEGYDWWTFVKTINKHVFDTTNSEDKQLGFFFCKAKDNIINAETFVCKVIFYLWNDVFKDFSFENPIFADKNDAANPKLSFDKFYLPDGKIRIENVSKFLTNLGLSPVELRDELIENEDDDLEADGLNTDDNAVSSSERDYSRFSINGEGQFKKRVIAAEVMKRYINDNPNLTVDEIALNWRKLDYVVARLVQTEAEYNDYVRSSKESEAVQHRFIKLELSQGRIIYVSNQFDLSRVERLSIAVKQLGWPYKIEKITE